MAASRVRAVVYLNILDQGKKPTTGRPESSVAFVVTMAPPAATITPGHSTARPHTFESNVDECVFVNCEYCKLCVLLIRMLYTFQGMRARKYKGVCRQPALWSERCRVGLQDLCPSDLWKFYLKHKCASGDMLFTREVLVH